MRFGRRLLLLATVFATAGAADERLFCGFERDLDGFSDDGAELCRATPAEGEACLRLSNGDSDHVQAVRRFDLRRDLLRLGLRVRSSSTDSIAIRLADATGQEFLHRLSFAADGAWHALDLERSAPPAQYWGGAGDGRWQPPCTAIALVVEGRRNRIDIDALTADLGDRIAPDFAWRPMRPSNVFISGEMPAIAVETTGDSVSYRITDFHGAEVAAGSATVDCGHATLRPPARPGYYLVRAEARRGGRPIAGRWTGCAVIPAPQRLPGPQVWGVATHCAQGMDPAVLPTLARAGIGLIRDEMYWDQVERERGSYALPHRFAAYHAAAQEAGLETLLLLSFANPLYDGGQTPHTPAGRTAFAAYGRELRRLLAGRARAWEVWNEFNGSFCQGPAEEDRPRHYAMLLRESARHLKRDQPGAVVLGGAAVLQPLPWFEDLFALGVLADLDGLVIHPYRALPEGVDREIDELRALMRRHGGEKPIHVTETGLDAPSEHAWERGLGLFEKAREESARYLVRQLALLRKAGCASISWYVATDTDLFKSMGLLRQEIDVAGAGPFAATATYVAYANLISQLGDRPFREREGDQPYSRSWCLRFGDGIEAVRVCWATRPAAFDLHTDAPLTVTDIMGVSRSVVPEDGVVRLPVGPEAVYVRGGISHVDAVPDGFTAIAASNEDFSAGQGGSGWSYGFRQGLAGAFQPMTWTRTTWDWRWTAKGMQFLHQGRDGCEPEGNAADPWYVDRRWTCPTAGDLVLAGTIASVDAQGDGLDLHVQVDGRTVWSRTVAGGEGAELAVQVSVGAGSVIDILVGPNQDTAYDACRLDLRVLRAAP